MEPDQERVNSIYHDHATKKKTSALFFGLLRDRSSEEQQVVKNFRGSFLWIRIRKTSALFFGLLRDRSGEEQQVVKYFRGSFL